MFICLLSLPFTVLWSQMSVRIGARLLVWGRDGISGRVSGFPVESCGHQEGWFSLQARCTDPPGWLG